MKTKVSPTLVGVFVLGALLLGVIALFSFGGVNFFSKPERFVVYFDETIHGLDNGSPVKLRGVRIGRVVGMNVRTLPPGVDGRARSIVAVVCELSRDVVADGEGRPVDVSNRAELQRLIDRGLRAQLGLLGLATGLLYVELDFYDPARFPAHPRADVPSDLIEMPAVKSAISQFQSNLTAILDDIRRVDFARLAVELQGLLADTRAQVNRADFARLSREWTAAAEAVRGLADSPEARELLANAAAATRRFDSLLASLEGVAAPAAVELREALREARIALSEFTATAAVVRRFVNAQRHLGDDASQAFARLAEAADAVARLADFLERNPNALLSGRATGPAAR